MSRKLRAAVFVVVVSLCGAADKPRPQPAQLVDLRMIWGRAPHNGSTDLIRYRERFFCVFREGRDHISPDGALRVLSSADGGVWQNAAPITLPGTDLRDPKLSITPDGRMLLNAGAAGRSMVWFSSDGREWSEPRAVGDPNVWLWRITWHLKRAYSVGYSTQGSQPARLYSSADGLNFAVQAGDLQLSGEPSEASLLFLPGGAALCLSDRSGANATAALGETTAPYRAWSWNELNVGLAGPNLIRLPDERIVAAGRVHDSTIRTALAWVDPEQGTLTEFLTLPSSGDTGYPGLAFHDGLLWVSYYSSHEGRAMIYLATVRLPPRFSLGK